MYTATVMEHVFITPTFTPRPERGARHGSGPREPPFTTYSLTPDQAGRGGETTISGFPATPEVPTRPRWPGLPRPALA
jgi:hypothetical protein